MRRLAYHFPRGAWGRSRRNCGRVFATGIWPCPHTPENGWKQGFTEGNDSECGCRSRSMSSLAGEIERSTTSRRFGSSGVGCRPESPANLSAFVQSSSTSGSGITPVSTAMRIFSRLAPQASRSNSRRRPASCGPGWSAVRLIGVGLRHHAGFDGKAHLFRTGVPGAQAGRFQRHRNVLALDKEEQHGRQYITDRDWLNVGATHIAHFIRGQDSRSTNPDESCPSASGPDRMKLWKVRRNLP